MKLYQRFFLVIFVFIITGTGSVEGMAWDTYSDTWVLTDALGRSTPDIMETGKVKKDKYVLIFYHNWHYETTRAAVNLDAKAPRNVTEILTENADALQNEKVWGGPETYHYWGEPIWGYYSLRTDDYVIRKHAQMLTDAGVDAIVLDYTNYLGGSSKIPYEEDLRNLLKVFLEIKSEGGDVPQVVIMATWDYTQACKVVDYFYDQFYTDPDYDELWFKWEGKPLFLAWDHLISDEMKAFFTLRRPYPFGTPVDSAYAWPWNSAYPQMPAYTDTNDCEMVTVGVAGTHPYSGEEKSIGGGMSEMDENGYFIGSGRSSTSYSKFLSRNPVSNEYRSENGSAFQENFDRAIALEPDIILVTGWNEWIAARFTVPPEWSGIKETPPFGIFFDQFCSEYSRDIEPTRDGNLGDNFYNQLIINIRKFKGTGVTPGKAEPADIIIDGEFADWDIVTQEFRDDMHDTAKRDSEGIGRNTQYVNHTGRNDFKMMKVSYDKDYVYFYVETVEDMTPYTDNAWMNLFIRIPEDNGKIPDWEGYQYIVNRTGVEKNRTLLEKSKGGYAWEKVNDNIKYAVSGRKMELAIPKTDLGIKPDGDFTIDFKWHDNMQVEGDFFECYLNGDSAPNSRFNYRYAINRAEKSATGLIAAAVSAGALLSGGIITGVIVHKRRHKPHKS